MGNKRQLRFSSDGTFRILMMSDIQESASYDPRSLRSVNTLIDLAKPDLVLWGGDNCYGPEVRSAEDLKAFLDVFTAPMESRGIPWAHVYGNHDHDVPCDIGEQQALYESYPHCVSEHTDETVHGKSNFLLPILGRDGSPAFAVWGLDSNNTADELDDRIPGGGKAAAELARDILQAGRWSIVYFDQLMWYWNRSVELERRCGKPIPGMLCMHIAPHEFTVAASHPDECVIRGSFGERLDPGVLNSGLFSAVVQRGDVRTIACGHTHMNDFEAEYCGVRLCWDACAGYRCYGDDQRRGGRLFVVQEADPAHIQTEMLYTSELV